MLIGLGACEYDPLTWTTTCDPEPTPVVSTGPASPSVDPGSTGPVIRGLSNQALVVGAVSLLGLVVFIKVASR